MLTGLCYMVHQCVHHPAQIKHGAKYVSTCFALYTYVLSLTEMYES